MYDSLTLRLGAGRIYRDVNSLKAGAHTKRTIEKAIKSCNFVLAVIGKHWLTVMEGDAKRIDKPNDFLRLELVTALNTKDLTVIPVLVDDATPLSKEDLPDDLAGLAELNVIEISDQRWSSDVEHLIGIIEGTSEEVEAARPIRNGKIKPHDHGLARSVFGGAVGGLITSLVIGVLYQNSNPEVGPYRFIETGLFGLAAGIFAGISIPRGIARFSKLTKGWRYSKIIGGAISGALAGIPMSIMAAFLVILDKAAGEGGPIDAALLMWGLAVAPGPIAIGILWQDLKVSWLQLGVAVVVVLGVMTVGVTVYKAVLDQPALNRILYGDVSVPNMLKGLLLLGCLPGAMLGFQVGSTLFAYDLIEGQHNTDHD